MNYRIRRSALFTIATGLFIYFTLLVTGIGDSKWNEWQQAIVLALSSGVLVFCLESVFGNFKQMPNTPKGVSISTLSDNDQAYLTQILTDVSAYSFSYHGHSLMIDVNMNELISINLDGFVRFMYKDLALKMNSTNHVLAFNAYLNTKGESEYYKKWLAEAGLAPKPVEV